MEPVTANNQWTPVVQEFDGVPMVQVPPGCSMMGMTEAEIDDLIRQYGRDAFFRASGPEHQQCQERLFWIDQTEVTQQQFAQFEGIARRSSYFEGADRPVDSITWFEARDFCALRGARLPTEAEWEYAARGPDGLIYPWGNTFHDSNVIWGRTAALGTADVGSIPDGASWVGALDMSGNVWEWVFTVYGIDLNLDFDFVDQGDALFAYPYESNDGREVDSDDRTYAHVLRGGAWNIDDSDVLHAAFRSRSFSDTGYDNYGFRCARSS